MSTRILVMGLPGAGKTWLSKELHKQFSKKNTVDWFNADKVREQFNDWDFSTTGRIRQSVRMRELADSSSAEYVICDFVAPLNEMREIFSPHYSVWVDTIVTSRFNDTTKLFERPSSSSFVIKEQNARKWAPIIATTILLEKYSFW